MPATSRASSSCGEKGGAGQSCRSLCLLQGFLVRRLPGNFRNERDPTASITADLPYRSLRSAASNRAVNDKGTTTVRALSLRARPEGLPDPMNLFAGEGDRCIRSIGHDMNVYCGCRGHNGGHKPEPQASRGARGCSSRLPAMKPRTNRVTIPMLRLATPSGSSKSAVAGKFSRAIQRRRSGAAPCARHRARGRAAPGVVSHRPRRCG